MIVAAVTAVFVAQRGPLAVLAEAPQVTAQAVIPATSCMMECREPCAFLNRLVVKLSRAMGRVLPAPWRSHCGRMACVSSKEVRCALLVPIVPVVYAAVRSAALRAPGVQVVAVMVGACFARPGVRMSTILGQLSVHPNQPGAIQSRRVASVSRVKHRMR